jgi:hypothetical protein
MVPATLPATRFNFIYAPHMGEDRQRGGRWRPKTGLVSLRISQPTTDHIPREERRRATEQEEAKKAALPCLLTVVVGWVWNRPWEWKTSNAK